MIRRLYAITSDYGQGFEPQIRRTLELGCDHFGLSIGVFTRIIGERVEILHLVAPPDAAVRKHDVLDLKKTLCSLVAAEAKPVGLDQLSHGEFRNHPAHREFGFETYIGAPVFVEGELFGTVCFTSPVSRGRPFSEVDLDTINLMASWVAVEIQRRRTEEDLRAATAELLHLTRLDPLTELLNRRGMQDALDRISQRVQQGDPPFTALLVDLDGFKQVNERYGHAAGDLVLREVARRIRNAVRPTDVVARIGGDEYLLALPGYSGDKARRLAERVRHAVSAKPVITSNGPVFVTASIGSAEIVARSSTISEILAVVGEPLAASKQKGKNRVSDWRSHPSQRSALR
jgi:diguanylate cyclase (GGDEF)-like protein